jgi:uncharacterized phage-associated protein
LIISDYRNDADFKAILQDIIRQKGRFDAIGLQAHMHRGNWPLWQVWDLCDRFQDFNVPIHFSEVTILSGAPKTGIGDNKTADWPSTQAGEIAQAAYAENFYRLLFSHPAVSAITWWDFSDLEAWQGAPAGLLRKDMSKKPAYNSLLKLIQDEWRSRGNAYTDDNGIARIRGFYGQYKLVVEKETIRMEGKISISKGLDNQLKLQLKEYKQKPPTPLWQQVWPYLLAAAVLALIIFIGIQIDKARRRI